MDKINNKTFDQERALYSIKNTLVENCRFEGPKDGESALKESENIEVNNCYMDLRYPLWHVNKLLLANSTMTKNCRAALWYTKDALIDHTTMNGIKALRECRKITLKNCLINSPEFGWRCHQLKLDECKIKAEYAFFESRNIKISNMKLRGKYSFQYTQNVEISQSTLKTKDAFWHAKNVVVRNSVLIGEYIGWYSNGLTLINCHIKGTQPFCYCKNLKLIDCTTEDCDLAFEYSDVEATINGSLISIKNPLCGTIIVDNLDAIITEDSKYQSSAKIVVKNQLK